MIKSISVYFVFLFIVSFSYAQNTFVKVLGRETNDIYNDMDETTNGGILFGGNYFNDYCLTRCNSVADTVWSKLAPLLSEVNIYDMCTLGDGSYALAGSKSDPAGGQAAVLIIDSACLLNNVDFYISDDGWSMVGLNVYPMPDSGVMFTAYEDGYTCSNVLNLYSLDKTLNPVWSSGIGLCDADIVYSKGYGSASQIMHFLKTHYYEVDSLGNWHENVPHIISRDINGITTLDSWQFIDKTFTGISNVSDSSVIMYGYLDSMGSKQIHLLKLSNTGSVIWSNSFGTLYDDFPVDLIETDDNGFAILASQTLPGTDMGIDIVFYKLDSQGQLQFSQTYGSTGNETAVKMIRKKDGSLLILGRTNGFGSQVNMVIQLDNTGHLNPAYSIDAVADHYCIGETALLSVSRPALQYMWSTGETTSSINVTTSGNYDVTVIDSSGISHVVPFRAIYFDSWPDASLVNGASISICDGQTVSLSTAFVNGNIYQWYNDGVLIDTALFNTYNTNQPGIYKVIVNNSCGSDTSLEAVVTSHSNPPVPTVSSYPGLHSCSTSPVMLYTNSNGNTVNWNWASNNFTGDTLTLSQPDRYYISVFVTDAFGCESTSQTVQVIIDGPPNVTFLDSVQNICIPGSTLLPYTYSANYGMFYFLRNDTLINTLTTPSNINATRNSVFSIVMSNSCGSDTTSVIVIALSKPMINIFPSDPVLCSGAPVLVTCTTPGTYRWSTNWNPSQTYVTTSSYLISGIDNYRLELTDPITNCTSIFNFTPSASSNVSPVINPISDAFVCPGNSINLDAGNFVSYLWNTGSTASNISMTNSGSIDTTNITVTVVDVMNCSVTDSAQVIFDICASVNENNIFGDLRVYPNPSSDRIIFEIPQQHFSEDAFLYVFNMEGKLMMEKKFSQSSIELSVSDFPPSVYSYMIQSQKESVRGVVEIIR